MSRKVRSIPCKECGSSPVPIELVREGYDLCLECYRKLLDYYLKPIQW